VACCPSHISWRRHATRSRRQCIGKSWRMSRGRSQGRRYWRGGYTRGQREDTSRLETRRLGESPAAGGAARSGSSTASREPVCTPRCLSRRTFRKRYGKVAEALCPYTPYGQRRAGACILSYILPAMTSSSAAGSVVKNCC
jgi:hypothetical protein